MKTTVAHQSSGRSSLSAQQANRFNWTVRHALASPSLPLAEESRTFMENRFGHDFSRVGVRADASAAESARALDAQAYGLQRKCACGGTLGLSGECAECRKKKLQRKLKIGASNDPLEMEADRIADQVLATPVHSGVRRVPPHIQRFAGHSSVHATIAPASVDRVLASPGRPLEPALEQDMEQCFGHDFSRVRVHSGTAAERSARDVNANAYTVGHNIVFGADRFAPGTHEGRRLIAHELTHVVQQSGSDGIRADQNNEKQGLSPIAYLEHEAEHATQPVVARDYYAPAIDRGRRLALQRQADPASPDSSDTIDLAPADDLTEKNPKVVALATKARHVLSGSPQAKIVLLSFWSSASTFGSGGNEKQDQLRGSARSRAETILRALVKLGVPAGSISVSAIDLNEDGAPKGTDGHTEITLLRSPVAIATPKPIVLPPVPATPVSSPLLDLDKDADLTQSNLRLAETIKYSLLPSLKDPGGTVKVVAYEAFAPDVAQKPASGNDPKLRESAQSRAYMVRDTMKSLGVNDIDIDADVKFVPAGDKRDGHILIAFAPKPAATKPESGLDFDKFTTIEVKNPNFSLVIKIPKSIELKLKAFEAKLSIPKGGSITLKPVRGIPGLEIGLSGEITKLADLIKSPTPTPPGPSGFTQPKPGPPVKFSLSIGVNGKGYKVDATGSVDLNKRAITAGISFSLLESSVKYQVPSSVFDDLNKAGAQLQKAVNKLMGVADQPAARTAIGQPPAPPPAAPAPDLSDLFDVVDAVGNIIDAMDKIDKAKEKEARPTLKIAPTVTIPFGPPREGTLDDPLGNKPVFGVGVTGTFD